MRLQKISVMILHGAMWSPNGNLQSRPGALGGNIYNSVASTGFAGYRQIVYSSCPEYIISEPEGLKCFVDYNTR